MESLATSKLTENFTTIDVDVYSTKANDTTAFSLLESFQGPAVAASGNSQDKPVFLGYWELLLLMIGAPVNTLVLYQTVVFLRQGRKHCVNERRHQSNLWFIFSMTLSDVALCCIHAPMMFAQYVTDVVYNAEACLSMHLLTSTCTISSSLSLLWLNIDKFIYLNQPLHYRARVTTRRAVLLVLSTWLISIIWTVLVLLGPFTEYTRPCTYRPKYPVVYLTFAVGFFVVPTLISLLISIYIAFVVCKVGKRNAERSRRMSSSVLQANGKASTTGLLRQSVRTIAFVFTTTIWSTFTYLPYRIAYLIYVSLFNNSFSPGTTTAVYALLGLMSTNAAGNPLITILTQKRYTTAVMASLRQWCCYQTKKRAVRPENVVQTAETRHIQF